MIESYSFVLLLACSVPDLHFNFFVVVNDHCLRCVLYAYGRFGDKGELLPAKSLNEGSFSSVRITYHDNFVNVVVVLNVDVHFVICAKIVKIMLFNSKLKQHQLQTQK